MKFSSAIIGLILIPCFAFASTTRCLSGPSVGPNLVDEMLPEEVNCPAAKPYCVRVDATLFRITEPDSDRNVVYGGCVKESKCKLSSCIRFLADLWSVNFTDPREGSTDDSNELLSDYHYEESGGFFGPLRPSFDVRFCDLECCDNEDFCNEFNTSYIRSLKYPEMLEATTPAGQGATSIQGLNLLLGLVTLISTAVITQNL